MTTTVMPYASEVPPRTERVLRELKEWCDTEPSHGKRAKVARYLKLPHRQTVTNWLNGSAQPTAEQILGIIEFLERYK